MTPPAGGRPLPSRCLRRAVGNRFFRSRRELRRSHTVFGSAYLDQTVTDRVNYSGEPGGHLLTDDVYEDYRLEVEYRFAGEPGNCGVLVHASTPRALYDMFPQSIKVQMMHENAGDFWCIVEDIAVPSMEERRGPRKEWGITEGKKRRILNLTDGSENPVGEWNTMVIEAVDDEIKVWVNGDLVNYGYHATAQKGRIAIQAEGSEVEFRKLELTPIAAVSR